MPNIDCHSFTRDSPSAHVGELTAKPINLDYPFLGSIRITFDGRAQPFGGNVAANIFRGLAFVGFCRRHQYKGSITFIGVIQCQNRVPGSARAGEEIHHNVIAFIVGGLTYQPRNKAHRFRVWEVLVADHLREQRGALAGESGPITST